MFSFFFRKTISLHTPSQILKGEKGINQYCLVSGAGEPSPADSEEKEEGEEESKQDKIELVGTDGAGETCSKFKIRISKARSIRTPALMAGDS